MEAGDKWGIMQIVMFLPTSILRIRVDFLSRFDGFRLCIYGAHFPIAFGCSTLLSRSPLLWLSIALFFAQRSLLNDFLKTWNDDGPIKLVAISLSAYNMIFFPDNSITFAFSTFCMFSFLLKKKFPGIFHWAHTEIEIFNPASSGVCLGEFNIFFPELSPVSWVISANTSRAPRNKIFLPGNLRIFHRKVKKNTENPYEKPEQDDEEDFWHFPFISFLVQLSTCTLAAAVCTEKA